MEKTEAMHDVQVYCLLQRLCNKAGAVISNIFSGLSDLMMVTVMHKTHTRVRVHICVCAAESLLLSTLDDKGLYLFIVIWFNNSKGLG